MSLLVASVACYGEASVPTAPGAVSTIVAATMQAITPPPSATPGAPSPSPVAETAAPTAQAPAVRINFQNGATTGEVTGPIEADQDVAYVLQAGQGQPMFVQVESPQSDVTLSIATQGGTSLLSPSSRQSAWYGTLPQTEDYTVTVHGGIAPEQFKLTVEIASRIKFAAGADQIKIPGDTPNGFSVVYTVFAEKDKKMDVQVYGVGENATLAVWGYADGKTYLRAASNKTGVSFTIPVTQDYIIEIDPKADQVLEYVIWLRIK